MNNKIIALKDSSLDCVSGGGAFKSINQAMNIGGTVTAIVGGVSSAGLMAASFVCEYKGVNEKTCSLLKKLSLSSFALMCVGGFTTGLTTISMPRPEKHV